MPRALQRIRDAELRPAALATIFEQIGKMVEQFGASASMFQLDYQAADDEPEPDDLVPVITLAVRPATHASTRTPPDSVPASDSQ